MEMDSYLLILDDIGNDMPTETKKCHLTGLLTDIRHLNTSIILSLHDYKLLCSMAR